MDREKEKQAQIDALVDLAKRAANALYNIGDGVVLDGEGSARALDLSRNLGKAAQAVARPPVQRHKIGAAQDFPGTEVPPAKLVELNESTLRGGSPRGKAFDWRNHTLSLEGFQAADVVVITIGGLSMLAKHRNGMPSGTTIKADGARAPVHQIATRSGADSF